MTGSSADDRAIANLMTKGQEDLRSTARAHHLEEVSPKHTPREPNGYNGTRACAYALLCRLKRKRALASMRNIHALARRSKVPTCGGCVTAEAHACMRDHESRTACMRACLVACMALISCHLLGARGRKQDSQATKPNETDWLGFPSRKGLDVHPPP